MPQMCSLFLDDEEEKLCSAERIKCLEGTDYPWWWRTNMLSGRYEMPGEHRLVLIMTDKL